MEVNSLCSGQQFDCENFNVPELYGRVKNNEMVNVETVGWFVQAVKEEAIEELYDNVVDDWDIVDVKRE
jgi:hypothetical protein